MTWASERIEGIADVMRLNVRGGEQINYHSRITAESHGENEVRITQGLLEVEQVVGAPSSGE